MAVRFLIEDEALLTNEPNQAVVNAIHSRLFDYWMRYGVMVINLTGKSIAEIIGLMPGPRRKMWQTAFQSGRFRTTDADLGDPAQLYSSEETMLFVSNAVDLICLETVRAEAYFLEPDQTSKYYSQKNFEICRFDCHDQSTHFQNEAKNWNKLIPSGAARDEIWNTRFFTLGEYSRSLSIVDRYAGKRMIELYDSGKICGLSWFLAQINKINSTNAKKKNLTLYLSDADVDRGRLETIVRKVVSVNKRNLASCHLHICPDKVFSTVAHDRFIRSDILITSLGNGMSIFENPQCRSNMTCTLQVDIEGMFEKKVEQVLRSTSEHKLIL